MAMNSTSSKEIVSLSTSNGSKVDAVARPSKPKLGLRIAASLGDYIANENLQVGDPIGSEAELAARFRTSRWTMREALSMLRREGIIEIRRGRAGGHFVAKSGRVPFSGAIRAYFEYLDVSIEEILSARRVLGELVLRLAMERLTLEDIPHLRTPETAYPTLLAATRNPVAQKFVRSARRFEKIALLRSSLDDGDYKRMMSQISALRLQQMEALIAHDFHGAWSVEVMILKLSEELLRHTFEPVEGQTEAEFLGRISSLLGDQGGGKPEILTHLLGGEIIARGWPTGEHLGSEQELLARYGVGRSVFREAVRPLEQTGLVIMQTGRNSGLKVGAPSLDQLISVSLDQFARMRAADANYVETLLWLFVGAAGLASEHQADIDADLHCDWGAFVNAVAGASGNRVIATMILILVARGQAVLSDWDESEGMRQQLLTAIHDGDTALARRVAFLLLSQG